MNEKVYINSKKYKKGTEGDITYTQNDDGH